MKSRSENSPDEVIDALLSANRVLVAVAARSLSDIADEVTLAQYRTLVVLASRGPQNLAGLADAIGVTPATATRMCDRLARNKLILRRAKRSDRRQVRLALSAKGVTLVSTVTQHRQCELEEILRTISNEDRAVLVQALNRFAAAASEVPE